MLVLDEMTAARAREGGPPDNPVLSRWQRALGVGARAEGDAYPDGETGSALDVRRERLADVFREESALLAPISAGLAARALVAIVADPDGVILSSHGGGTFLDPAARIRLVCGALWSEQARGTNAIGTAIVERQPVAVLGSAHLEERNHGLFCYATPVRDAYGDLACVLDVTGPMSAHDPAVAVAVQAAGAGLERALRAMSFAQAGASVMRSIERLVMCSQAPAFLAEPDGVIRVVNDAARGELAIARGVPLTCDRVFGASYNQLLELAVAGERPRFETRSRPMGDGPEAPRVFDVMLDPILGANGRALAITVHLSARSTPAYQAPLGQFTRRRSDPPLARDSARDGRDGARESETAPLPNAFAEVASMDDAVDRAKIGAARFAETALPVLILAETGTGKELFARAIHRASSSARGPFVPVNCGAVTKALLESELFGYAAGAFTGASPRGAEGKLAAAHGGTLFLDEVAEMPEALQAALLRVLEDGTFTPVGDARPRKATFRLICATCRDLPALVLAGAFREDLFYRIYGASVTIPPLRQRQDRVWLARTLLARVAPGKDLDLDAEQWVMEHDWPGNVRELLSAVAHAAALAGPRALVRHADFPVPLLPRKQRPSTATASPASRKQIVADAFQQALDACDGNVTRAAEKLGVARSTLYRAGFPRNGRG